MLDLTNITVASVVHNDNPELLTRTVQVLRYCDSKARWHDVVLFSAIKPRDYAGYVYQIPELDRAAFQVFLAKCVDITSDYLMWVHEDGFPINWPLWGPEFLSYDFIGAPWQDKVVGNDGFSILSKRLLKVMANEMPWHDGKRHTDEWLCRDNRMEDYGLTRAPFEVAKKFSVEHRFDDAPAFGFHHRVYNPDLYAQGWKQIEEAHP